MGNAGYGFLLVCRRSGFCFGVANLSGLVLSGEPAEHPFLKDSADRYDDPAANRALVRPKQGKCSMLAYRFFVVGIIFAIVGMCVGIWMGLSGPENFIYAPVHAHINLVGWATHFLFGLYYRGEPEAARGALPQVHFWVAVIGAILLVIGVIGAVMPNPTLDLVVIPGSILTLLSMVIFLIVVAGRWRNAKATA